MDNFVFSLSLFNEGLYIVEKGDTIKSIALKFNTTKNLIIYDNFLSREVEENDYLYIKCYKTVYTVTATDTLKDIAEKFNKTEEEILRLNRIKYIYPTQKIVID